MKRRTFCRSALGAAIAASMPVGNLLATSKSGGKILSDIPVVTRSGGETIVAKSAVKELSDSMRGQLYLPDHAGYDAARTIWNGMFNRRPALVASCEGPADVMNAVNFARAENLLTSVRSGGHSISGKSSCEGGMMINLSSMNGVRIDPIAKTARVEAGALLYNLDHEAQAFGLATTTGTVSHTGCAGLTLGGGLGRLGRVFGLTCDNLLSADIITADGKFLTASEEQNADLFWGLRGGGGNFGIVTSFQYQLHDLGPKVLGGAVMYPMDQARDVYEFYGEYSLTAPDELNVASVTVQPPGGKGMVILGITYLGPDSEGERVLAPLRAFGKPMMDTIGSAEYLHLQTDNDRTLPHGLSYYMKAGFLKEFDTAMIENLVGGIEPSESRSFVAVCSQLGGAIGQVGQTDTAFSHRDAQYDMLIGSSWSAPDEDEENVQAMRDYWSGIAPFTHGFYVNNAMDEDGSRIRSAYGDNYDRLVKLKNQYDPTNFFHLNVNIEPNV